MKLNPQMEFPAGYGDPSLLVIQARARGLFSAGSVGVLKGSDYTIKNFGSHSSFGDGALIPVEDTSLFDVASVTKSVPVALLVMWAITEGHLNLDMEVEKILPGLRREGPEPLRIRHLLAYSSRFHLDHLTKPYGGFAEGELMDIILNCACSVSHTFHYSNYQPLILGVILERMSGQSLESLAQEVLFNPLLLDATFTPKNPRLVVTTEVDEHTQQPLCGTVHDELTRAVGRPGAAGLFATTIDMLTVLRFLLNKGSWNDKQVIREDLVSQIGQNQFEQGTRFGLGFGVWEEFNSGFPEHDAMGHLPADFAKGAFFKNGFTGVSIMGFPALDMGIVIHTNHVHPKRDHSTRWMNLFRHAVSLFILSGKVPFEAKTLWKEEGE